MPGARAAPISRYESGPRLRPHPGGAPESGTSGLPGGAMPGDRGCQLLGHGVHSRHSLSVALIEGSRRVELWSEQPRGGAQVVGCPVIGSAQQPVDHGVVPIVWHDARLPHAPLRVPGVRAQSQLPLGHLGQDRGRGVPDLNLVVLDPARPGKCCGNSRYAPSTSRPDWSAATAHTSVMPVSMVITTNMSRDARWFRAQREGSAQGQFRV